MKLSKTKKWNRQKSVCLSEDLLREIENVTHGCISTSSFVRLAITHELTRLRRLNHEKDKE